MGNCGLRTREKSPTIYQVGNRTMENPKEEELKVLTEAAEKLGISMEDISRDPRTR